VHAFEARLARAHTSRQLKFTLPGPMTLVDTVADRYFGDRERSGASSGETSAVR
jgi:5-methyltetrahydropteroyltriglutamate--homocysteine methyltransferase